MLRLQNVLLGELNCQCLNLIFTLLDGQDGKSTVHANYKSYTWEQTRPSKYQLGACYML